MVSKKEKERLAALKNYEILDTEQDNSFDRITKLASIICDTPIALVSLVDENRQWFKSKKGLDEKETPRSISFCQYAIMGDDCFEVEDATKDERFRDNPLVTSSPEIRFYAGSPLKDPNGFNLGTVCVIDKEPKKLSKSQKEALQLLAEETMQLILSRKRCFESDRLAKLFDLSLDLMTIADMDGHFLEVNESWATILGYDVQELKGRRFIDFIHPDDIEPTYAAISQLEDQKVVSQFVNRYRTKDGSYRLIEWKSMPEERLIYAVARDITEQEQTKQEISKTNNILKEAEKITKMGAWELDLATNKTVWTDEVYNIHEIEKGFDHNKLNGIEFYHPDYRDVITDAITNAITNQTSFDEKCKFITAKGNHKWVRSTGHPIVENGAVTKLFGVFIDITDEENNKRLFEIEKNRLASIIEGTNVGTWEWNVQTGETVFNDKWAEIIGYTLEELAPIDINTWTKYAHPEDLEESGKLLNQHFERKLDYYNFECRMKHKEGHWVWVLDRGKVFSWTEDGKPLMMYGTHQDISHRKEIESSLVQQNQLISSFYELSPIGIALNDFETGKFIQVNQFLLKAVGYSFEEFVNLSYFDLTPERFYDQEMEMLESLKTKGKYGPFEKEYIHKDGSIVPVLLNGILVDDVDGTKKIWSIIEDISQQKKREKEQLWRLEFQQLIAKHSSSFILTNNESFDLNVNNFLSDLGKHLGVDRAYLFLSLDNFETVSNTHEWCESEISSQKYDLQNIPMEAFPWLGPNLQNDKLIHIPAVNELPDEAAQEKKEFMRQEIKSILLLELFDATTSYGFIGFDSVKSSKYWSEYEMNTLKVIANTIADVLRKRKQEHELASTTQKLESVLSEVDDVIWSVDASDYSLILITPSAVPFYGYPLEDWYKDSQIWAKVVHPDDKHIVDQCFKDLNVKGEYEYEYRIITKSGELKWVKNKGKIVKDTTGGTRIDGSISDISREKKYLADVESSKKLAEKALQVKEEFLANISHEIRTPLNAIVGFSEVLAGSKLSEEQKKQMEIISLASNNLMRILNDVLDTSKLDSGNIQLERRLVSIPKICQELVKVNEIKANENKVPLLYECAADVPDFVIGDETRINQIFNNVLSNALKFTAEGYVRFNVSLVKSGITDCVIRFEVEDTGIGIPKDKQQLIFKRFVQAETFTTRKYGGTGLGMSIVKSLVDLHKGTIELESEVGKGTTIIIDLPFTKAAQQLATNDEDNENKQKNKRLLDAKILIVEDNPFNQELAKTILTNEGAIVTLANDGLEGVEQVKNHDYDLVLMDLQMPNMDGYQATKVLIQEMGYTTPIIACSAHSLKEERENCLAIGMKDYISKPFKSDNLVNTIHNLVFKTSEFNLETQFIHLKKVLGEGAYTELVSLLKKRFPEKIDLLQEYMELNKKEEVLKLIQQLIGTLSYMGISGSIIAEKLQKKLSNDELRNSTKEIQQLIDYLEHILHLIE